MDRTSLEVVRHGLIYASEEMGISLKKSAYSPNIRERMDHSCALLDEEGRVIGQAEHIPVHIGSLPLGLRNTLRYIEEEGLEPRPGDMYVLNDPYIAGTHLNDVTVIRPVFRSGELIGYTANKAHQVDIGGIAPASISIEARELFQEGLIIPPVKLMEGDALVQDTLRMIRSNTRMPETTLGDLRAQVAAALMGERRLLELVESVGMEIFRASVQEILDETERLALAEYGRLPGGVYEAEDYLELGEELLPIRASLRISPRGISVSFAGTAGQVEAPLNSVLGVTTAAVSYVVKAVACPHVDLNDGFNRTIEIDAPLGSLVNPVKPAPVAAGNLETSQRIADVMLRAFSEAVPDRVPAGSCGSMNNLMMGGVDPRTGRTWAFYETIGGGYGGRRGRDGVDGVHANMTNTLNTSIEVMELYYPVRFISYRLREGSGGPGEWRGGLGIERGIMAEAPLRVSIISDRSRIGPWGLMGGGPGAPSEFLVLRRDGRTERIGSKSSVRLEAGDAIIMRTAGGGGYGDPKRRSPALLKRDVAEGKLSREEAERLYGLSV